MYRVPATAFTVARNEPIRIVTARPIARDISSSVEPSVVAHGDYQARTDCTIRRLSDTPNCRNDQYVSSFTV